MYCNITETNYLLYFLQIVLDLFRDSEIRRQLSYQIVEVLAGAVVHSDTDVRCRPFHIVGDVQVVLSLRGLLGGTAEMKQK